MHLKLELKYQPPNVLAVSQITLSPWLGANHLFPPLFGGNHKRIIPYTIINELFMRETISKINRIVH